MYNSPPETGTKSFILRFPAEILCIISGYLSNADIKILRLAGRQLCATFELRFSRVFLSANPRDVDVFRAVAGDDTMRHRVQEIIYDDTRIRAASGFIHMAPPRPLRAEVLQSSWQTDASLNFKEDMISKVKILRARKDEDVDRLPQHAARAKQLAAEPKLWEAWNYCLDVQRAQVAIMWEAWNYCLDVQRAQVAIMTMGADMDATLRRVVVTPAVRGYLYTPLYETPSMRAAPYGMNDPLTAGWGSGLQPYENGERRRQRMGPIPPGRDSGDWPGENDRYVYQRRLEWRGVLWVLKTLASQPLSVPELVLDNHYFHAGLPARMLAPGEAFDAHGSLRRILSAPGFRRLSLPLLTARITTEADWSPLTNGNLQKLLSLAPSLEHFELQSDRGNKHGVGSETATTFHPPLQSILPLNCWATLRHFGLVRFLVSIPDLIHTLAALPPTLRSVELSFLDFVRGHSYRGLLESMKENLDWKARPVSDRPQVTVAVHTNVGMWLVPGRGVWVTEEVCDFLYNEGENPVIGPCGVMEGVGVARDAFEREYERPNLGKEKLYELGYRTSDNL